MVKFGNSIPKFHHILHSGRMYRKTTLNDYLYCLARLQFDNTYWKCADYSNWKTDLLGNLTSKFATGLNPRKNFVLGEGANYYVTIKNLNDNYQVLLDDKCDKISDDAIGMINKRSDLKAGDLLFSGVGTIGRMHLIEENPKNWNINESVFTVRAGSELSSIFLFMLMSSRQFQGFVKGAAHGSVQKGIRMADMKAFELKVPPRNVVEMMDKALSPIITCIKNNERENRELANLRDTLLSKLVSGEIGVSKVAI